MRSLTEARVDTAVESNQNLGLKGIYDTCCLELAELSENEGLEKALMLKHKIWKAGKAVVDFGTHMP